ncbi:hypothetical protein [Roseomonas cutis]|nr:hypothetical protein [Roseomonas sp. OT10]
MKPLHALTSADFPARRLLGAALMLGSVGFVSFFSFLQAIGRLFR